MTACSAADFSSEVAEECGGLFDVCLVTLCYIDLCETSFYWMF